MIHVIQLRIGAIPAMMNRQLRLCAFLLLGLMTPAADNQWTQFRGPNGSGVDSSAGYPVEFSPSKNVVWKTAIPFAQSSPVLAGGRVYLTASEPEKLLTICLDAKTGPGVVAPRPPSQNAPGCFSSQRSSLAHSRSR